MAPVDLAKYQRYPKQDQPENPVHWIRQVWLGAFLAANPVAYRLAKLQGDFLGQLQLGLALAAVALMVFAGQRLYRLARVVPTPPEPDSAGAAV